MITGLATRMPVTIIMPLFCESNRADDVLLSCRAVMQPDSRRDRRDPQRRHRQAAPPGPDAAERHNRRASRATARCQACAGEASEKLAPEALAPEHGRPARDA